MQTWLPGPGQTGGPTEAPDSTEHPRAVPSLRSQSATPHEDILFSDKQIHLPNVTAESRGPPEMESGNPGRQPLRSLMLSSTFYDSTAFAETGTTAPLTAFAGLNDHERKGRALWKSAGRKGSTNCVRRDSGEAGKCHNAQGVTLYNATNVPLQSPGAASLHHWATEYLILLGLWLLAGPQGTGGPVPPSSFPHLLQARQTPPPPPLLGRWAVERTLSRPLLKRYAGSYS